MIPELQPNTAQAEIDGITYTSTKWPCMRALELFGRATIMAGERGLAAFVASELDSFEQLAPLLVVKAQGVQVFGAMVQASYGLKDDPRLLLELCSGLRADKLHNPGGMLLPSVVDLSDPKVWDQHFTGELPHLVRVLRFVLRHNLLGFTLGLPSQSGSPGTPQPSETDAP